MLEPYSMENKCKKLFHEFCQDLPSLRGPDGTKTDMAVGDDPNPDTEGKMLLCCSNFHDVEIWKADTYEVKGGTKRELWDCAFVHVCECGLAEAYNKCYLLAPDEVKEKTIAMFAEYFPGEYTIDEGVNPYIIELCKRTDNDTVKEKTIAMFAEYFPGEYTIDEGVNPYIIELCKRTDNDTTFEVFRKVDIEMRQYEREVQTNPFKTKESMQMHHGKVCMTPFLGMCIEFGNKCG
ncbi:hypothetical protein TNIN_415051 [Trichonephila inaurata madagascariensis]|uniref:Uncharacterized protein n=1 Tax=Trichonephila inaurata madagascariensis TaxID=2747483 RepID=A0A8X6YLC6_9ARAC|nr:hypothetical protein TNIN_415051 [Trichonephila inaurata madagascariensis]